MLKSMNVPARFWGEAVSTVVYVLNRCPTKSLDNVTPFEAWHKKKPNVSHLRTFGCVAHVKQNGSGINKLSDRSSKMLFIGYESGTKGYRFNNPASNKLVISRDVIFDEMQPWDWENTSSNTDQWEADTFVVHYDQTDQNQIPTVAVLVDKFDEGEYSAARDGDVDPHDATPSHHGTPCSVQGSQ